MINTLYIKYNEMKKIVLSDVKEILNCVRNIKDNHSPEQMKRILIISGRCLGVVGMAWATVNTLSAFFFIASFITVKLGATVSTIVIFVAGHDLFHAVTNHLEKHDLFRDTFIEQLHKLLNSQKATETSENATGDGESKIFYQQS